ESGGAQGSRWGEPRHRPAGQDQKVDLLEEEARGEIVSPGRTDPGPAAQVAGGHQEAPPALQKWPEGGQEVDPPPPFPGPDGFQVDPARPEAVYHRGDGGHQRAAGPATGPGPGEGELLGPPAGFGPLATVPGGGLRPLGWPEGEAPDPRRGCGRPGPRLRQLVRPRLRGQLDPRRFPAGQAAGPDKGTQGGVGARPPGPRAGLAWGQEAQKGLGGAQPEGWLPEEAVQLGAGDAVGHEAVAALALPDRLAGEEAVHPVDGPWIEPQGGQGLLQGADPLPPSAQGQDPPRPPPPD